MSKIIEYYTEKDNSGFPILTLGLLGFEIRIGIKKGVLFIKARIPRI